MAMKSDENITGKTVQPQCGSKIEIQKDKIQTKKRKEQGRANRRLGKTSNNEEVRVEEKVIGQAYLVNKLKTSKWNVLGLK